MIEDYQAKRRRSRAIARWLLAAGVVLAIASAVVTYAVATRSPAAETPDLGTVDVVVAARDLPPRTAIAAADVRIARAARDTVPEAALRAVADAIGRVTTQSIARNEVVLPAKFTTVSGGGVAVFPEGQQPSGTTPDYRAMSVDLLASNAVGGAVQAGDTVDILFAIPFTPAGLALSSSIDADYAARILAERVAVLARDGDLYTFRLDAAQAERLAAVRAGGGAIHLLLRAGDDTRVPRASGALFSNEAGVIIRAIPTSRPSPSPAP